MFLGFSILGVLFTMLGVVAINSLSTINSSTKEIAEISLPSVDYAHSINTSISDYRIKELRYVVTGKVEEYDGLEEAMISLDQEIKNNINAYKNVISSNQEREIINSVEAYWEAYLEISERVIKLSRAGKTKEALDLGYNESREAFDKVSNVLLELIKTNHENADKITKSARETFISTRMVLLAAIIISVIICLTLSVIITRSIVRPIKRVIEASDKLALGDVNNVITNTDYGKNEIGMLATSFRKMVNNIRNQALVVEKIAAGDLTVEVPISSENDLLGNKLSELVKKNNEVLSNIYSSSEQIAAGAKQASDSSVFLSEGATEQASAIEELTASIEEISSQTELNAQNSNQANELSEDAKLNAQQGNNQMQEMLKAMDEINEASTNIAKVIKVIDDIAFQTNILALNAAVEAARAGQHGKGFAVVAEEVRNLAARSANAAKETTDMIEGSIKKSEGGTKIARDTAQALDKIVDGIEQVATLVSGIANASNEQAIGIKQINQGIMQVSQVVQSNSATSQESAAISEELSSQAAILKETVNQYKLKRNINTNGKYEKMNPDVLKMLENMSLAGNNNLEQVPESQEKMATPKPNISFREMDYGKY